VKRRDQQAVIAASRSAGQGTGSITTYPIGDQPFAIQALLQIATKGLIDLEIPCIIG
jgi:hypothetical protein